MAKPKPLWEHDPEWVPPPKWVPQSENPLADPTNPIRPAADPYREWWTEFEAWGTQRFDLLVVPPASGASGLPAEGTSLVALAIEQDVLYFRIFNADGQMVVDTDESHEILPSKKAKKLKELKERLDGTFKERSAKSKPRKRALWGVDQLTLGEKALIIPLVTAIVGQAPEWWPLYEDQRAEMRRDRVEWIARTYTTKKTTGEIVVREGRKIVEKRRL